MRTVCLLATLIMTLCACAPGEEKTPNQTPAATPNGSSPAKPSPFVEEILKLTGVSGGVCVLLECTSGQETVEFARTGRFLVHEIVSDSKALAAIRKLLADQGVAGLACVDAQPLNRLPHMDNLVNLIVAKDLPDLVKKGLTLAEILRALAPHGMACLGVAQEKKKEIEDLVKSANIAGARFEGKWLVFQKPRPAGMDDWAQGRCGMDGASMSRDEFCDGPNVLQWIAGPCFGEPKSAGPAGGAPGQMLSCNGRNFYVNASGIVCRDAFNGAILWIQGGRLLTASGDEVYVHRDKAVTALNAGTGQPVRTFANTAGCQRWMACQGLFLSGEYGGIRAYDAATGSEKWYTRINLAQNGAGSIVVDDGKLFCVDWPNQLHCVDSADGKILWKKDVKTEIGEKAGLVFSYKGGLLFRQNDKEETQFMGVSTKDGAKLWTYTSNRAKGGRYAADAYPARGLVWVECVSTEFAKHDDPEIAKRIAKAKPVLWNGLDPQTGKVAKSLVSPMFVWFQCYPQISSERFLVTNRPNYFVDWMTGSVFRFEASRPGCGMPMRIAQGMLYSSYTDANVCMCVYPAISGVMAFASDHKTPNGETPMDETGRVEKGPAAAPADPGTLPEDSWPVYRHDGKRLGSTVAALPQELTVAWQKTLTSPPKLKNPPVENGDGIVLDWPIARPWGHALTAPTMADGKVFVGLTHAQQAAALDVKTGQVLWTFTAAGRLDTPPTYHRGLCFIGSHDGWVYAVRANDGQLVWRGRVGPAERRRVGFGQLESAWPVIGGVVASGDAVFALGGRTTEADGGLYIAGFEAATGKCLWTSRYVKPDAKDAGPYSYRACGIYTGWGDMLCCDGKVVSIEGVRVSRMRCTDGQQTGPGYSGPAIGLLTSRWSADQFGQQRPNLAFVPGGSIAKTSVTDDKVKPKKRNYFIKRSGMEGWQIPLPEPMNTTAFAASSTVALVGVDPQAADNTGGELWILSLKDGSKLDAIPLPAVPVFDGIAIGGGQACVSLQDGSIVCLKAK